MAHSGPCFQIKTLADPSGEKFTKEDRRGLARAICGMANVEGGRIIVGIETKRIDNVDVAITARPISNPAKLRNFVVSAIPEMLSPQHTGISVIADESGLLAIDVPPSGARPHYSNVHHQYFRRGSDGTRVMEHGEIRELMLAVREGSLEIDWLIRSGSSWGDLSYNLTVFRAVCP